MYQFYLGMPGNPIEYTDRYLLSDDAPQPLRIQAAAAETLDFARYEHLIADLTPAAGSPARHSPFPTQFCRRTTSLQFNVADYSRQLLTDFLIAGGKLETVEFHQPSDLWSYLKRPSSTAPATVRRRSSTMHP